MDQVLSWLATLGDMVPAPFAFWRHAMPQSVQTVAVWVAAIAFFMIPAGIVWASWRRPDLSFAARALAWAAFLVAFVFGAWRIAQPLNETFALPTLDALAATSLVAGILCLVFFWVVFSRVVSVPSPAQLIAAKNQAEGDLAVAAGRAKEADLLRADIEKTLREKREELDLTTNRLDVCLRGARVHLFSQDRDFRYVGIFGPRGQEAESPMLGKTDEDLFGEAESAALSAAKRKVLETGEPEEMEVWYDLPEGRALLALHIEPIYGADGAVTGMRSAAADITRVRALEAEQRRLAEELRNALHRYEIALRGSNITVFTHDRELRYTSISNAFLGRRIDQIVGLTDDDVVPVSDRAALLEIKRRALQSGEAEGAELRLKGGNASRWYDLHVEPLRDAEGAVVGLTGAAVDITERKAGEEHLRLLMRELTHRSKNLLAVIQALARQTSRNAGTVDKFLEQFSERLQALSRSHDLLVQEEWHSASLLELVRSQLGHYLDRADSQISIQGPPVHLKPEAAQSLGLALHELAVNAAKYGALSGPAGRVSVSWEEKQGPEDGLVFRWVERDGPAVEHPKERGFGTLAIQRNLARALEADVDLQFAAPGVSCTVMIPEKHIFSIASGENGT